MSFLCRVVNLHCLNLAHIVCLFAWCLDVLSGINVVIFDKRISKQAGQLQFLYSDDLHNDNMFAKSIWKNLKFLEAMCYTCFIEILQI
jgi:hypothetical protein